METGSGVTWDGNRDAGLRGVKWFTHFVRLTGPWLGRYLLYAGTWFLVTRLKDRRTGSEVFWQHLRGRRSRYMTRLFDCYRHFLSFALAWFDRTYAFLHADARLPIESIGVERLECALAGGRGAILLTAHVGNFELGAWALRRLGRSVHVVMFDSEAEAVAGYREQLRGSYRPKIIAINRSPLSALAVLKALKKNEIVCMQGDRSYGSSLTRLPFLGRAALFPSGPYAVAALAGAPVLPVFCRRLGGRSYQFRVHPALSDRPEAAQREYVQLLEREALQRPYDWFNLYDFWEQSHSSS
jgi:predicted LPLAT superfamily acyltransferase